MAPHTYGHIEPTQTSILTMPAVTNEGVYLAPALCGKSLGSKPNFGMTLRAL